MHQHQAICVFLQWLYDALQTILSKQLHKKELWTKFHVLRSSAEFIQRWKGFLEEVGIQSKAVFIQTLASEVFEHLIGDTYVPKSVEDGNVEAHFTFEEENAIRYMAGYVVRKLQKKFETEDIAMLIENDKSTILDANSAEWVNIIDRGGLVHVTDACYQLFMAIEHATRQELQLCKITKMDDSFHKHLENVLNADDDVLFNWIMITGDETEKEEVLQEMTKLWITIRGFSFAKSIMEKYRSESKKRTAKSKGLRTKLFTDKV